LNFQENACQYLGNKFSEVRSKGKFETSRRIMLNVIRTTDCVNYEVTKSHYKLRLARG